MNRLTEKYENVDLGPHLPHFGYNENFPQKMDPVTFMCLMIANFSQKNMAKVMNQFLENHVIDGQTDAELMQRGLWQRRGAQKYSPYCFSQPLCKKRKKRNRHLYSPCMVKLS